MPVPRLARRPIALDITDPASVATAADTTGTVSILVNNAVDAAKTDPADVARIALDGIEAAPVRNEEASAVAAGLALARLAGIAPGPRGSKGRDDKNVHEELPGRV